MTLTLPDGAIKCVLTETFTGTTVPKSLLQDNSPKLNSWGMIVVGTGTLIYEHLEQPEQVDDLESASDSVWCAIYASTCLWAVG